MLRKVDYQPISRATGQTNHAERTGIQHNLLFWAEKPTCISRG